MVTFFLLIFFLTNLFQKADVQSKNVELIDHIVNSYINNFNFSGNILIANSNSIIYQKSAGMANYELNIPNTPDTKFRLASISKQFTTAALLVLEQRGTVNFQKPISSYLPHLTNQFSQLITIHHLLSHSSGLPRDIEELTDQKLGQSYISLSEIINLINQSELRFQPGERWSYSNLGYALAAAIIESVSGQSYGSAIQTLIFEPLKMKNSGHENASDLIQNRASGYVQLPDGIIKARYEDKSYVIGAGSIYSTVSDLLIWSRELMSGTLISEKNRKRLLTRQSGRYSYGWFVDSYVWPPVNDNNTAPNLHHDGGSPGFEANLSLLIKHKTVVIVLANKLPSHFQGISNRISNVYLGFDESPPKADGNELLFETLFTKSIDQAVELIEEWIKSGKKALVPDKNDALLIGRGYLDSGQYEKASLTFELIGRMAPDWWMSFLFRGIALERLGNKEGAKKLYKKVLAINPNQSNALSKLKNLNKSN